MNNEIRPKTRLVWTGFFIRIFVIALISIIVYLGFFLFNLNSTLNKITAPSKNNNQSLKDERSNHKEKNFFQNFISKTTLRGEKSKRINILLLGIGGESHSGKYLTDTIIMASVNPKTYQSALLAIPRDLYVQIPGTNYHTKINALYAYGKQNKKLSTDQAVNLTKLSVEKITGETIHYYCIIDFEGFKKIIRELGGININVEKDIYDPKYPGPNFSYETFELSKGFHHLDAETALKYARVRHTADGDFGRLARQQQIIASVRERALSLKILTNPVKINHLLKILGEHVQTNIKKNEIPAILNLLKKINIHQTTTKVLTAWDQDAVLKSTHINLGGQQAYVLIPRLNNYSQIQKLAHNIFNLKKISQEKEEIQKENIPLVILTKKQNQQTFLKKLFKEWGYQNLQKTSLTFSKVCQTDKDQIIHYGAKQFPFSLSDLAEKLNVSVKYNSLERINQQDDLTVICISQKTALFYQKEKKEEKNSALKKKSDNDKIINNDGTVIFNNEN